MITDERFERLRRKANDYITNNADYLLRMRQADGVAILIPDEGIPRLLDNSREALESIEKRLNVEGGIDGVIYHFNVVDTIQIFKNLGKVAA